MSESGLRPIEVFCTDVQIKFTNVHKENINRWPPGLICGSSRIWVTSDPLLVKMAGLTLGEYQPLGS